MATREDARGEPEDNKDLLGRRLVTKKRTVQQEQHAKGDHAGITVNITESGAEINDILAGDDVYVCVHEDGIVIQHTDD